MSNEMIPYQPVAGMSMETLGKVLARSGYFRDATDEAKAIVKVLYGAELGFPPITSMMGIHIIEGKPAYSAHIMASAIKRAKPRYDYRIRDMTAKVCRIEFFEDGESSGVMEWTIEEAQIAGLATKTVWKAYPKAMLFNRAMAAGFRAYCAELSGGAPVYTPEELGADVDEQGNVIESTARPAPDQTKPAAAMLQHEVVKAIAAATNGHTDRRDHLYESEDRPAGRDPEQSKFVAMALELGYRTLDGKLDNDRVHDLFGLPRGKGVMGEWRRKNNYGWAELTEKLIDYHLAAQADVDEATAQSSLDGMPAVERTAAHDAVRSH